jgi:integrase
VPFLADTGLRIGEAAALRWRDVDTLRGTVTVRETLVEVPAYMTPDGTSVMIGPPKTRAGLRTVPTLTDETAARLVARRAGAGPDDFVWATPTGVPLRPKLWRSRVWRPAVLRAGLVDPQPTPHTLRHTAVALWIAAGTTDAYKLQRWAGHRSVTTIYRVYGHLLPTDATEERTALTALRSEARSRVAERKVIALPGKGDCRRCQR